MKYMAQGCVAVAVGLALAGCGGTSTADSPGSSPSPSPSIVIDDRPLEDQLRGAIRDGDVALVEVLIGAGVNVNHDYGQGVTPLFVATLAQDTPVVQLLIDSGADVNAANARGTTVVIEAAQVNNYALMTTLLEAGADWTLRTGEPYYATALHFTTFNDSVNSMLALLEFGVPVDYLSEEFQATVLMYAAFWDAPECARLLVEWGADTSVRNDQDMTPLGIAYYNRSDAVAVYLESIGAPL